MSTTHQDRAIRSIPASLTIVQKHLEVVRVFRWSAGVAGVELAKGAVEGTWEGY
jgi:hypothetical protein